MASSLRGMLKLMDASYQPSIQVNLNWKVAQNIKKRPLCLLAPGGVLQCMCGVNAACVAGGRHTQDADEQLPAVHGQPTGDPESGQQDPRDGRDHQPTQDEPRVLPELCQGPTAVHQQVDCVSDERPQGNSQHHLYQD